MKDFGPHLSALAVFGAVISGFVYLSGAATSGFSLTEDHEIAVIRKDLERQSLFEKYWQYQVEDLEIRFRPFNCLGRVLEIAVFGSSYELYHFSRAVLGILTAFLLYLAMRWLGSGWAGAMMFAALSTLGPHASTWWRLATYECWGLFFVALALLAMAAEVRAGRRTFLLTAGFFLSLAASSLVKESFLLVIPAFAYLRLWSWMRCRQETFVQALIRDSVLWILLGLWCVADLAAILLGPGPMGNGYAGYKGFDTGLFVTAVRQLAVAGNVHLILLPAILALAFRLPSSGRKDVAGLAGDLPFAFLVIVPNLLLFQQTGFYQHYFLPAVIGTAYLTARAYEAFGPRIGRAGRWVFLAVLAVSLAAHMTAAFKDAQVFARECRHVGRMIAEVTRTTDPGDVIVIAGDPARHFEWSYALKQFLELRYDRKNLVYLPTFRPRYSDFEKVLIQHPTKSPLKIFGGRLALPSSDLSAADVLVVLPTMEFFFLRQSRSWFDRPSYGRSVIGPFVVYRKNAQ